METIQIHKAKWVHYGICFGTGFFIAWFFLGPYDMTRVIYAQSPNFTILLGFIFFGLFFYSIKELILKRPEIILSAEGIEIRRKGWNHWAYVNSISMVVETDTENGNRVYLTLFLKDATEIKCLISDLNRTPAEIVNLAREFKNKASEEPIG